MDVQFAPVAIALGVGPYPAVLTLSHEDGADVAIVEMHANGQVVNTHVTVAQLRAIAGEMNELADALDPPAAAPSMRVPGGAS